jgi:hypothetical protein
MDWTGDFSKLVEKIAAEPRQPFKPHWWYNKDGDMIEIYWSDEAYVAKWLNPQVTVLYSVEDPTRIVGVQIEGIKKGMAKDAQLP